MDKDKLLREMRGLRESMNFSRNELQKTPLSRSEIFDIISRVSLCQTALAAFKQALEVTNVTSTKDDLADTLHSRRNERL
jgi:predicted DNA-binding protein YlxM (UPF0122 family)